MSDPHKHSSISDLRRRLWNRHRRRRINQTPKLRITAGKKINCVRGKKHDDRHRNQRDGVEKHQQEYAARNYRQRDRENVPGQAACLPAISSTSSKINAAMPTAKAAPIANSNFMPA